MRPNKFAIKIVLFLAALGATGCNGVVTDYVKQSRPSNTIDNPNTAVAANGPTMIKISPGQMKSSGGQAAVQGNVTATNKFMTSTAVSASVAISRSRTSL